MYIDKTDDDENADKSDNTEETLEDKVNENDIKLIMLRSHSNLLNMI